VARLEGFACFAVDGARCDLPRPASHEAWFEQSERTSPPQARVTVLWRMGLVWLWSWRIGPRRADARSPLRQMLDTGPPAARRMGEAGFIGYAPGRQVLEATCHLLRRGGRQWAAAERAGR
jgi:hypothetical protein